jgi:hypothetical protein
VTMPQRETRGGGAAEIETAIETAETDAAIEPADEAIDAPEPGLEAEAEASRGAVEADVDPIVVRPLRAPRAPSAIRAAPSPTRAPAATSSAPSPGRIDPGLGALVDAALADRASDPATAALPESPPARELAIRLRALERDIAMCRPDDTGLLRARIVLDGATGSVRSVVVTADSASAAPSIDCATRLIAATTVPRFARDHFALTFPYRL